MISAVATATVAIFAGSSRAIAGVETAYSGPANDVWSNSANWTAGEPQSQGIADLFSGVNVNYDLQQSTPATDLMAVQIAGASTLTISSAFGTPYLQASALDVGGTTTGSGGAAAATGAGIVLQTAGTVSLDPQNLGTSLVMDSASSYSLGGTGLLIAYNEQLAGSFIQTGGQNQLSSGAWLKLLLGQYNLTGGTLNADTIVNTGTFTESAGSLTGSTTANCGFNNSGSLMYTGGTFTGSITNNVGGFITVNNSSVPFTQGVVDNGSMTCSACSGNYSGAIGGTGTLVFNSNCAITISGSNTFSGQATVSSGTVTLSSPVGTAGNNFGSALGGNVVVGTSGILVMAADYQIANTSLLTINGGTLNLSGHNQSVGTLDMTGGSIQTTGAGLGVVTGAVNIGHGSASIADGLRSSSAYTITVASGGTLSVDGLIAGYTTAASVPGLTLTGGGTLITQGGSPLVSIDVKQGILQLSAGGSLGNVNSSVTVENAGTLNLNNQSLSAGDLIGAGRVLLGSTTLTVASTGSTFSGSIQGTGSIIKNGTGTLILSGSNAYSGSTTINGGGLTVANGGSLASSAIAVNVGTVANLNGNLTGTPAVTDGGVVDFGANPGSGILARNLSSLNLVSSFTGNGILYGSAVVASPSSVSTRTVLTTGGLSFPGSTNAWKGQLDLTGNDMIVHNGNLATLTNQLMSGFNAGSGYWNGSGIISSAAASNTSYLTTLGIMLNNDGSGNVIYGSGTSLGLFDGVNTVNTDVLVKYTYYGDTNLDGQVDGSDYTRTDNGFDKHLTGWSNGDYNYDGVVDGSDYTLIDNAFNTQGANLSASSTNAIASVPEPAALVIVGIGLCGILRRRPQIKLPV